jgi:hypothetical protein
MSAPLHTRDELPSEGPGLADSHDGEEGGGEELFMYLEPGQLVAETRRPVPRAQLSPRAAAGLWVLRIAVVLLTAMVLYAFIARLT